MTALTLPVPFEGDTRVRPVPWRRMVWVIWRHHRVALGGVAAFLGALAAWLWVAGLSLHHAYSAAVACHPAGSATCSTLAAVFESTNTYLKGGFVLQPVPALIGAFVGPLVLAREYETGTFRFAWTQAFGRWRWVLAKLVALGLAVAAAVAAFSAVLSWYYEPYVAAQHDAGVSGASTLSPGLFDLRGIALVAWTLAAFAMGALAGMLIRRIVPSIVATLAAYAGLALLTANVLREHYLPPRVADNAHLPSSAWILSSSWTKDGTFVSVHLPFGLLPKLCPGTFSPSGNGVTGLGPLTATQCLVEHGYTQWSTFQPVSHFWPFQWIEGGWLLALAALLAAVTVWLVRHRAA